MDNNPHVGADVVHDLNTVPYPFADNSVDEIIMDHSLEHLDDPIRVLIELYRTGVNGADITIKSPHFSCNWLHPGHKSAVSAMLFDYFNPLSEDCYGNCSFEVKSVRLRWLRPNNPHGLIVNMISKIINFFANLYLGFCQRIWCYWVGGFEEIEFKVKVIKNDAR